jgi:hypothetical protein
MLHNQMMENNNQNKHQENERNKKNIINIPEISCEN